MTVSREPEQHWVEVSLEVEDELAEPVAEVLTQFLTQGVVLERTVGDQTVDGEGEPTSSIDRPPDQRSGSFPRVRVYGYLPRDDQLKERQRKIREALYYLGRIRPLPEPVFRVIKSENWAAAWRERYRPLRLGDRLIIVPTWLDNPDPGMIPIYLDPGMAFGSGTHPSTQLALELLLSVLEPAPPERMLDIGCGSGILSIAAVKLGIKQALGVDIDSGAVGVAQDNASVNRVEGRASFHHGSITEVLSGAFQFRRAPLVAANLIAPYLHQLLDEGLAEAVLPGGHLVLSGLLEDQSGPMIKQVAGRKFRIVRTLQQGDWVGLLCKKLP